MKTVSGFEAALLRILHGILGQAPASQFVPLLAREPRPPCLSPEAIDLVQDALSKGVPLYLARVGGWRRERFLRRGRGQLGRLWERSTPEELALSFSAQSMEFLLWLTASKKATEKPPRLHGDATPADQLLCALGYEVVCGTDLDGHHWPGWDGNALFHLLNPGAPGNAASLDWQPWLHEPGSGILEAMQSRLAERWLHMERSKAGLLEISVLHALSHAQELVLNGYLDALHDAGRWDLARFLLEAARGLFNDAEHRWLGSLNVSNLRMQERLEAYRSALMFPRLFTRLAQWEQEARDVGYFDDGYGAAQMWKADWESHGGVELLHRARELLRGAGL